MADEGVGGVSEWRRECRGSIDEPVAGWKHNKNIIIAALEFTLCSHENG